MLSFEITANDGRSVSFSHPVSVSLSSSDSAPADSLRVSFAVTGRVPALQCVTVTDEGELLFSGRIDRQTELLDASGTVLTVYARSAAAVLLDNEAVPRTYISPSMPLLMSMDFEPLGIKGFIGPDKAFSGELTITKGMSEWAVLKKFSQLFLGTEPKMDRYGVIDVSGATGEDTVILPSEGLISLRRELKNSALVSDIYARTRYDGGYDMRISSGIAADCGVVRRRFVNTVDGRAGYIPGTKRLMSRADSAYESITAECRGRVSCSVGDLMMTADSGKRYRIREMSYVLDRNGERTVLSGEAVNDDAAFDV